MKRFILTLIFIGLMTLACSNKEKQLEEKVRALAEPAANTVLKGIRAQVEEIVTDSGPIEAISFCSVHAVPITDTLSMAMSIGFDVKRTSNKYRNPFNAPDEFEKKALAIFEKAYENDDVIPPYYVQKVSRNNKEYYDFYKPMAIQGSCLTCHAEPEVMESSLVEILEKNYPGDLAVGYESGEFRGAIRVAVPAKMVE